MPAERFWTLDPVDGTQGFVRGDHYVVALALIVRGRVEIGLIRRSCREQSTCRPRLVTGTRDSDELGAGVAFAPQWRESARP